MKTISFLSLLSLLVLFSACNKDDDNISLGQEFEIDYLDQAPYEAGDFNILFTEVLEESRCPINTICFWEGRAVVQVAIETLTDTTLITLATTNSINGDSLLTYNFNDYQILLKEVNPYPGTEAVDDFSDYSVVLELTEQ